MVPARVVSLGGGVQSSALTLMGDRGVFGAKPDLAVYADTGWDPPEVRRNVEWLAGEVSFPVKVVRSGNLKEDLLRGTNSTGDYGWASIPAFVKYEDGRTGMKWRQCTSEYKIRPIQKAVREFVGLEPGQKSKEVRVEQWMGISTDEVTRVKPAREKWVRNRYPLVEAGYSRSDCVKWWAENAPNDAPELVRSACLGCPFKSGSEWRNLTEAQVEETARVEAAIQKHDPTPGRTLFLHSRRVPFREAVAEDVRRKAENPSLFDEECLGYCGV